MDMYKNQQERIDAYLRNEMSEGERMDFERDLKEDEALARDLALNQKILKVIVGREEKILKMQQWQKEIEAEREKEDARTLSGDQPADTRPAGNVERHPHSYRNWHWWAGIGIAACVAVGLIYTGGFTDSENSDGELPQIVNQGHTAYRGEARYGEVEELMNRKEYPQALAKVDSLQHSYLLYCERMERLSEDSLTEEELYELEVARLEIYRLAWQKICILMEMHETAKVLSLLKTYRLEEGEYQEEAEILWNKLK